MTEITIDGQTITEQSTIDGEKIRQITIDGAIAFQYVMPDPSIATTNIFNNAISYSVDVNNPSFPAILKANHGGVTPYTTRTLSGDIATFMIDNLDPNTAYTLNATSEDDKDKCVTGTASKTTTTNKITLPTPELGTTNLASSDHDTIEIDVDNMNTLDFPDVTTRIRINSGAWQTALGPSSVRISGTHTFTGLDSETTYTIEARNISSNDDYSDSDLDSQTITTDYGYYTVTFEDYNGSTLKSESVLDGNDATPPSDPGRSGYFFTGWDGTYTNVTSDRTITAEYEENPDTPSVTRISDTTTRVKFRITNNDTRTLSLFHDDIDNTPDTKDNEEVMIGGESEYVYYYGDSGDQIGLYVRAAKYNPYISGYEYSGTASSSPAGLDVVVTFKDYNNSTLKTETIENGADATPPSDPSRTGYTFDGWSSSYTNVTYNKTIYAEYTVRDYTVTFEDYDGSTLKTETVDYGDDATPPSDPSRSGYVFTGWNASYTNITNNKDITAEYEAIEVDWVEDPDQGTYDQYHNDNHCINASDIGNQISEEETTCSWDSGGQYTSSTDQSTPKPSCSNGATYTNCTQSFGDDWTCVDYTASTTTTETFYICEQVN